MLIALVQFMVYKEDAASFQEAVLQQARNSLTKEPGCKRFDVLLDPEDPQSFLLYEIYDDRAAFNDHLATDHFAEFDANVADWVASKEVVFWKGLNVSGE